MSITPYNNTGFAAIPIVQQAAVEDPIGCINIAFEPEIRPVAEIVNEITAMKGFVDLIFWYEGTCGLSKNNAAFMKQELFEPILERKKEIKARLYSLVSWDFAKKVSRLPQDTRLGRGIERVNQARVDCLYASSFFRYCVDNPQGNPIYNALQAALPGKGWLIDPWKDEKEKGMTIRALFEDRTSLLDSVSNKDVKRGYSCMQYVEGYYLIERIVREKLQSGENKISICFVLPNDESKYYLDYPTELERMLRLGFGNALDGIDLKIRFLFFKYGETLGARPYVDKQAKRADRVTEEDAAAYLSSFNFA